MRWARVEAELVMFNAVKDLLAKTKLRPRQIDVLGEFRVLFWQLGEMGGQGCGCCWRHRRSLRPCHYCSTPNWLPDGAMRQSD